MSDRPRPATPVDGAASASLDFRLLGPVELWSQRRRIGLGRAESAKARCVLAVLLRTPGMPVSTDSLVERVWGERPVDAAARYKYIGWLRAALAPYGVPLDQDDRGYWLRIDADRVDLHRFRRLMERANTAIGIDHLTEALQLAERALALWRGPALSGLSGAWALLFREQLAGERRDAAVLRLQLGLTAGRDSDLLGELAEWETEYPTDETIIGLHVLALHRTGRSAQANACYRRAEDRLRTTLNAPVGTALQSLMRRIRDRDPALYAMPVLERYRPCAVAPTRPAAVPEPATVEPVAAVPRQLPPVLRQFAGRSRELVALTDLLGQSDEGGLVTTISGTAGIGKTNPGM